MSPRKKYTVAAACQLQSAYQKSERAWLRALETVAKIEEQLTSAQTRLDKATKRYHSLRDELDSLGIDENTHGFRTDQDGYVVPSKKLVRGKNVTPPATR